MKKLALLLLLVSVSFIGNAQIQEPTYEVAPDLNALTQKEFNYLTVGLKSQEEGGLDTKIGYSLTHLSSKKVGQYYFTGRIFVETATNSLKALSIKIESKVTNKTYYLAIPANGQDFMDEYNSAVLNFTQQMLQAYSIYLSDTLRSYTLIAFDYREKAASKK